MNQFPKQADVLNEVNKIINVNSIVREEKTKKDIQCLQSQIKTLKNDLVESYHLIEQETNMLITESIKPTEEKCKELSNQLNVLDNDYNNMHNLYNSVISENEEKLDIYNKVFGLELNNSQGQEDTIVIEMQVKKACYIRKIYCLFNKEYDQLKKCYKFTLISVEPEFSFCNRLLKFAGEENSNLFKCLSLVRFLFKNS